MRWKWLSSGFLLGSVFTVHAQPPPQTPLVLRDATIYTVTHGTIETGTIVIQAGKITASGPTDEIEIPADATVEDLSGKVIIPGLVDTHSHLGISSRPHVPAHADTNEKTGPVQSGLRALDAISPADPGIRMAQAGGITTANIMPGSGNVVGGQTAYVKYRGQTIDDMLIHPTGLDSVQGGMKMANGENPKRAYGSQKKAPATRMAVAALQRQLFVKAQNYQKKWAAYTKAQHKEQGEKEVPAKEPERDLTLEPVVEILRGKRTVHFHTHRADDILTVLRLADEFGFKLVLQHVTEGYKVAKEIARRHIPCSIIVLDSPGGKHEAAQFTFANAAVLEKAGVTVAIHTDDPITDSRFLLRSAALAIRGGMSEEGALKALTIHGAEMLDLQDRIGSIEVGKDADLVVLSGPPFSVYSQVLATYVEGAVVFDRNRPGDTYYATGGFAVAGRYPESEGRAGNASHQPGNGETENRGAAE